jgi:trehalose 6-phosphate phosphatase
MVIERLRSAVSPLTSRSERAGVLTDFDGTLAPIVEDPSLAEPLGEVPGLLRKLAARFALTAVVSGRPASFLQERLGLAGSPGGDRAPAARRLLVAGQYGTERALDGEPARVMPGADRWRGALQEAERRAAASAPPRVRLEPKGLGLTLHWREAPEQRAWAAGFAREQARALGLEVSCGRMSLELRPPGVGDKGTVVEELCAGLEAACFLGDDLGDLAAFEALDRLAAGGLRPLKVAVAGDEAPTELLSAADLAVDGPEGALEVLRALARRPR